jgi:murein DD-endopeptidase MepM/ murein hydrolase activator NlpD
MRRLRLARTAAVALLVALPATAAVAAGGWRAPVAGEVLTPFAFGLDPYARGLHRGVDLAARAGEVVLAPCRGRVRFAGSLPRHGRGVTIACGPLAATVLELGSTRVRRGDEVRRGAAVGTARSSHVHLGARRIGRRHGYLDPLILLGDTAPPLGPAPPPGRGARPLRPAPAPRPVPLRVLRPAPAPVPARLPAAAWAGLALIAAATPVGALVRRRRRLDSLRPAWPSTSRRRSST